MIFPLHDLQLPFSATLHDLLLHLHVMVWGGAGIIPHMSLVHTGTVDIVWPMVKQSLPHALHTNGDKATPDEQKIVCAWQWRWENTDVTSHELSHMTATTYLA